MATNAKYVLYKNGKPWMGSNKGKGTTKALLEEVKQVMIDYGDATEEELEIRKASR